MRTFDFDIQGNSSDYFDADTVLDTKRVKKIFDDKFAFELEHLMMRKPFSEIDYEISLPSWYVGNHSDDTIFSVDTNGNFVSLLSELPIRVCFPIYTGSKYKNTPLNKFFSFADEYNIKFPNTSCIILVAYSDDNNCADASKLVEVEMPDMGIDTYYVYLMQPNVKLKFPKRRIDVVNIICSKITNFDTFNIDLCGVKCNWLQVDCTGKTSKSKTVILNSFDNFDTTRLELITYESTFNNLDYFKNSNVSEVLSINCKLLNALIPGLFEATTVCLKADYCITGIIENHKDILLNCCNKNYHTYGNKISYISKQYYLDMAKLVNLEIDENEKEEI